MEDYFYFANRVISLDWGKPDKPCNTLVEAAIRNFLRSIDEDDDGEVAYIGKLVVAGTDKVENIIPLIKEEGFDLCTVMAEKTELDYIRDAVLKVGNCHKSIPLLWNRVLI